MNIKAMLAELISTTRRPNNSAELRKALVHTIREVHAWQSFSRDLVEEVVELQATASLVKIALPPLFRRIYRLTPVDAQGMPLPTRNPNNEIRVLTPDQLFTQSGKMMVDVAYITGPTLTMKFSAARKFIHFLYYANPNVEQELTETWIMQEIPEVIIDGALSKFYRGQDSEAQARGYQQTYLEAMNAFASFHAGAKG